MMGGPVNFLCDGQFFYRKPVCIIIRQVIIGVVNLNGDDSGLAVLGEMEFMGQDQPLDSVANIIKGRLKNINGDAFGMKDFPNFVIHGDTEFDFPLTVEFFYPISSLNEEPFGVGGQVDDFQGDFFRRKPDFMKGLEKEFFIVEVGGNMHGKTGDFCPKKKTEQGGGRTRDGEPFRRMGYCVLRIQPGSVPYKAEAVNFFLFP
mgnify:CR=1 FL=1